jgi:hypothetical protein
MKYHNHHLMSIRLPRPTISRAYVRGGRLSSDPLLLDSLETPQDAKTALEFAASSLVEFGNGPWLASVPIELAITGQIRQMPDRRWVAGGISTNGLAIRLRTSKRMLNDRVRIGCFRYSFPIVYSHCSAFWGDSVHAARQLVESPDAQLDFLVGDYLAGQSPSPHRL